MTTSNGDDLEKDNKKVGTQQETTTIINNNIYHGSAVENAHRFRQEDTSEDAESQEDTSGDTEFQEDTSGDTGSQKDQTFQYYAVHTHNPPSNKDKTYKKYLEQYYSILTEERILIINCFDNRLAFSVADQLIRRMNLRSKQRRMIEVKDLTGINPENVPKEEEVARVDPSELLSPELLNQLATNFYDWDKPNVVLIDAHRSTESFLNYHSGSFVNSGHLRDNLKNKLKRFLICITDPEALEHIEMDYPTWNLDFLRPFLYENDAYSADELEEFHERINDQRKRGSWGNTQKDFFKEVQWYRNQKQLIERIREIEELGKSVSNNREVVKPSKEVKASKLVNDSTQTKKIIIFAATYFPDISFEDFDEIVKFLLKDKSRTEIKIIEADHKKNGETIITETNVKHSNGHEETVTESKTVHADDNSGTEKKSKEILLLEDWQQDKDSTLEKLYLKIVTNDNGYESIDFIYPYLRDDLTHYFSEEKPSFLREQAQAIRFSEILFRCNVDVLDNVIQLMIDMARKNPEKYGRQWLLHLILQEKQYRLERIARIIKKMLQSDYLKTIADNLFYDLIAVNRIRECLHLIKWLFNEPAFDVLYWLKKLANKVKTEEKNEVLQSLYSYLRKGGNVFDTISSLNQWLPDKSKHHEQYSESSRLAFRSLIYLFMDSATELNESYYGQWPSRYLFFRNVEQERRTEQVDALFGILVHPGTDYIISQEDKPLRRFIAFEWTIVPSMFSSILDIEIFGNFIFDQYFNKIFEDKLLRQKYISYSALLTGMLIGKWRIILQGKSKKTMEPEAELLYQEIINCFHNLDKKFQVQVTANLNALKNILMEENAFVRQLLMELNTSPKLISQITREITARTNYVIKVRKDLRRKSE